MDVEQAVAAAQAWIAADPDPDTREALQGLVDRGEHAQLCELMGGQLRFGTAGLRAIVGPGPLRMNRAVVRRTTAGVARHIERRYLGRAVPPIVVAADARGSSAAFLSEAVGVLAAHGLPVRHFERPIATPIAAYVARRLSAAACIVITASHNPAEYNGYKLYGPDAAQIVSPEDELIASEIERSGPASSEPMLEGALGGAHPEVQPIPAELIDDYFRDIATLRPEGSPARDLRIAYTPLHGVGALPVERALREAGFAAVFVVAEQREPDGRFPTVAFPNPEEPGALDRVTELAREKNADLVIANDPDADRLAASLRLPDGTFRAATGNQLGILLADFLLERAPRTPQPLVVQSVVSSPMLRSVAAAHGARHELTLTGFKWIWSAALELMAAAPVSFIFGYEEALGYSIGQLVRDKDGISAALVCCELAALERARGSSLALRLERLYRRHGLWVSVQRSLTRHGSAGAREIEAAMQRVSSRPPRSVGGVAVSAVRDYRSGAEARPRWLGNTDLVELELGERGRLLVRPSGTEPKLKLYVDLRAPLADGADVWRAEAAGSAEGLALADALARELGMADPRG